MKVEPLLYGDRKVYSVAGFNRGVADWLARLPTLWIEGEVTELRRNERWGSVFFTLKDPEDGACLPASIPRRTFDALKLDLAEGERIHVLGRAELFAAKGEFRLRALSLERFGLGAHLAAIERLKQALAARGCVRLVAQATAASLPAPDRARHGQRRRRPPGRDHDDPDPLPAGACPRRRDARPGPACRRRDRRGARGGQPRARDRRRHPHPRRWQLRRPAPVQRRERRSRRRGLPGTDRLGCRARAGHAAVRPRCGRARVDPDGGGQARRPRSRGPPCRADARPRLARTLRSALDRAGAGRPHADAVGARARRAQGARPGCAASLAPARPPAPGSCAPRRAAPGGARARGGRLAALSPRATLGRGYAIVRAGDAILRTTDGLSPGEQVDVELAEGAFGARVEEVRP